MELVQLFLIISAVSIYLMPTIKIYSTLKKYDDKTPGFFNMQIRMATYLKKYDRLNKIQCGKGSKLCKTWYFALMFSVTLIALAIIVE